VLREGGHLFLEMPNGRRPEATAIELYLRMRGHHWAVRTAPLTAPFHLTEWSRRSIERALGIVGFEVVSMEALAGRIPYPIGGAAGRIVHAVELAGDRFGAGVSLEVLARAVSA
jgi:hypothetical protein